MDQSPWSREAIHHTSRNLNVSHERVVPTEADLIAADLAYNASKATHHERNDARALRDQIMLDVLMRSSA